MQQVFPDSELTHHAENLSTSELVMLVSGSGLNQLVNERAEPNLSLSLPALPAMTLSQLHQYLPELDQDRFDRLMAGIELGRRVDEARRRAKSPVKMTSTKDAKEFCEIEFARLAIDGVKEEFHIVTLDTKNGVIRTHLISVGTLDASLVHPREVFRPAIGDAAASIICVHNHPSGDPQPSKEDHAVTRRLKSAGKNLGIDVLDHIIVARDGSLSITERG